MEIVVVLMGVRKEAQSLMGSCLGHCVHTAAVGQAVHAGAFVVRDFSWLFLLPYWVASRARSGREILR